MKHNIKKSFPIKLLQSLLIASALAPVYADDTEIFYTESKVNSNVLFVMDNSGSMSKFVKGTDSIEDMVVTSTIDNSEGDVEGEDIRDWIATYYSLPWPESWTYYKLIRGSLVNTTSSDLELARADYADGNIQQAVGLRFTGINIEKNTVIKSAYIQFTADADEWDTSSDVANLQIQIENRSTPQEFIPNDDYSNIYYGMHRRNYFNETVNWSGSNLPAWNTPNERGDAQKTPDLKDLVQKAVNRWGWSPGKPMVFRISGTGKRSAQSFDYDNGSGAPKLVITYEKITPLQTRLEVMQSALKTVLKDAPSNLSVGISHYGNRTGSSKDKPNGIKFPVTSINTLARPIVEAAITIDGSLDWHLNNNPEPSDTVIVREYLSEIADSWEAKGATPIVDALYEAARYYKGDKLYWGNGRAKDSWAANATTYTKPAPDLVEAIVSKNTVEVCAGVPASTNIWKTTGIQSIKDYADDGRMWWSCPSDVANPPGALGYGKEFCTGTLKSDSCGTRNPEWYCLDWKPKKTEETCDKIGPDEDGNYTNVNCKTKTISKAYCKDANASNKVNNRIYNVDDNDPIPTGYGKRTYSWCTFKYCQNKSTKKPVPEYISPAIADCQSNNIILMSDGKPEYKGVNGIHTYPKGIGKIKTLIENAACENAPFGFKSGKCGKELTHYLAENDINPDLSGDQFIDTHVIGFSSGITAEAEGYLKSLVTIEDDPETAEKEGYFSAQNEAELAAAFAVTLDNIAEEARSQASPGYSVNVKSGLEHEDDIYIPVFDKSSGSRWSGNLKKFKLVEEGEHRYIRGKVSKEGDSDATGYINAMTELGLFKDDAWDEWSTSEIPDGNNVEKGGTASLLIDPRKRNLYTNVFSNDLSHPKNRIKKNNNSIKNEMLFDEDELGLSNNAAKDYRKKLISFIRGWIGGDDGGWGDGIGNGFPEGNIPSKSRKHMGDMLHSEPVVITYQQGDDEGVGREQYLFAATNEGYLHVFDSSTGEEIFAFMPKELLKNIHGQYTQEGDHVYGIDGNISYFIKNDNHNGVIDGGEKVWLYFGLRRGGTSYYALDVTDIDSPKLKWVVKGGDTGFEHLNQSWSAPYIANSKVGGVKKPVIIFTGGNDPEKMDYGSGDSYTPASVTTDHETSTANGVYIVDANDGTKLWDIMEDVSGAASKLTHGIPGGARILDVNRNGYLDRLYFADTGGFVWRLDLDEDLGSGSVLTKFADLGGTDKRKFYNEPDVAILDGGKTMFSVSLGSGIRPHPMNEEISDHMFVLLDKTPFKRMDSSFDDPIEIGDLENVSVTGTADSKGVAKSTDFEGKKITEIDGKKGWYVTFGQPGEKVLATSITFEGSIIFTTLVPKVLTTGELISICAAPATQGRMYAMDLLTGEASMDLDNSGDEPNDNDVFVTISASEIPGSPQRVFNKLECSNGSCVHDVDVRIGKKSTEAGTTNVESIESVYWNTPETVQ